MASSETVYALVAALQQASHLLLVAHLSPDGDSLGSLLALRQALLALGKSVEVFVSDGVPAKYQFLPGAAEVKSQLPSEPLDCTVVLLDCGEWERTGLPDGYRSRRLFNIDHHRTSRGIGQINWIDATASATGELVYYLLQQLPVRLDQTMATCLYAAIVSDTGWFRFTNTTAKTHQIAGDLLLQGARHDLVYDALTDMSRAYLRALTLVLERLEVFHHGQGAISWIGLSDFEQVGLTPSETEGLIDYPRSLPGAQVAALVVETAPGVCKVSLRSRQQLDVSQLAAEFGGGGHARAAGCTISSQQLAVTVAAIRAAMERGLDLVRN